MESWFRVCVHPEKQKSFIISLFDHGGSLNQTSSNTHSTFDRFCILNVTYSFWTGESIYTRIEESNTRINCIRSTDGNNISQRTCRLSVSKKHSIGVLYIGVEVVIAPVQNMFMRLFILLCFLHHVFSTSM